MIHRWDIVAHSRIEGEWREAEVLRVTHVKDWWYYVLRDLTTNEVHYRVSPEEVREIPEYAGFQDRFRVKQCLG